MLPALQEIDKFIEDNGFCFQFPAITSTSTDVALAAQGRSHLSNATVTAFVDDLSGSAPLDIRTCTDLG